jgi:hypothetical protein
MDAGMDAGVDAGVNLQMALHRTDAGIQVVVNPVDDYGHPLFGLDITVETATSATQATVSGIAYYATVVPGITSGELPITAHVTGSDAGTTRTALIVPDISAGWDQPESLSGLVNTPGTEDSETVSPDGEWLIVATYSPVDVLCCVAGCGGYDSLDGRNPACDSPLGPIAGPARPNLPGAERVVGGHVNDAVPQLCAAQADGGPVIVPASDGGTHEFALPPVGGYLFHRQSDGTFAEPHVIDIGADGFLAAPACFTFLGTADAGAQVLTVFGYQVEGVDTKPHPFFGQLTMGQDNVLGHYACNGGTPQFTPLLMAPLAVGPAGQQAINTTAAISNGNIFIMSDDESASPPYTEWALSKGDGGFTDWQRMALPLEGHDRRQPIAIGDRIFYYLDGNVASVSWDGGTLSDAGSFSGLEVELGPGTVTGATGELVALGQPTFALHANTTIEMYFVYYRRTATGYDGQIGRVPLR